MPPDDSRGAFGPFTFDFRERLVRRDGAVVTLAPKAVDILGVLLQADGKLTLKDELWKTAGAPLDRRPGAPALRNGGSGSLSGVLRIRRRFHRRANRSSRTRSTSKGSVPSILSETKAKLCVPFGRISRMAKKRRMIFVPEVNSQSFVFFFEKGDSGESWSIRDYSVQGAPKTYRPSDFRWRADEIHQKARTSLDAPAHPTGDLAFWHDLTMQCNRRYLGAKPESAPSPAPPPAAAVTTFPVLNRARLTASPKGRKPQDMDRILHSRNSEDWVTWNLFQVLLEEHPKDWWRQVLAVARSRNSALDFQSAETSPPAVHFWPSAASPREYEKLSRTRMLNSGNPQWVSRAKLADPVEGSSEIDVVFDHAGFLVYVEAKLGSDVSMNTTYDPQRNQIIRNIDCLIENAGNRRPVFWMLVRDQSPTRAYAQLMNAYRGDPGLLVRSLPHRDPDLLRRIARDLTLLQWSDFRELTCGQPGRSAEHTAVKRELENRIRE